MDAAILEAARYPGPTCKARHNAHGKRAAACYFADYQKQSIVRKSGIPFFEAYNC